MRLHLMDLCALKNTPEEMSVIQTVSPKKNSTLRLGVVVREGYLKSRMSVFEGVTNYCLENTGLLSFLIPLEGDEPPQPEVLAEVDALVTWGAPRDHWIRQLWESGVPLVNCNNTFVNEVPTVTAGEPYEMAYGYLKTLQRKTVGFVTRSDLDEECRTRFKARMENESLEWRIFSDVRIDPGRHPEHLLVGAGELELERFLMELPKPAALWCIHDEMAALVWRKAVNLGIHVPDELALIGFGDHPCAVHSTPGITTVRIPGQKLGHDAARLLHMHLFGEEKLTSDRITHTDPGSNLIERASTGGTNPINRGIQRAWRLLEDYPPEGLTVDQLIEEARASRVGFYKEFERTFHMLPGKAIRISRVRKAMEYLLSSDMPISQVGRMCGFSGESEFTNFFKRETGRAPKDWRRSKQGRGDGGASPN
ncbi:MAG: helix-turn-helix domain-containing protein [Verrucomicrobiaceae bacterium]|nr:MAG: helix-turn-helix domain-containing protein [Verrucomicrobiaceae bacterium]